MLNLPNWLIVYGTNRNCGKTTLITRIIEGLHAETPVCAVKISPHFHEIDNDAVIIARSDEYVIVKEVKPSTGKDSSRMLDAGAELVLYVQVWDNNLDRVLPIILENLVPGAAVVCESGWARNLVMPGVFVILNREGNTDIKSSLSDLKPLADRWIEFDGEVFNFDPEDLIFENGNWKLA
jgi:hypothetical protein